MKPEKGFLDIFQTWSWLVGIYVINNLYLSPKHLSLKLILCFIAKNKAYPMIFFSSLKLRFLFG